MLFRSTTVSQSISNGNSGTASHAGWGYSVSVQGGASKYNGYGKASNGNAWPPTGTNIDGTGTAGYIKITAV